MEDRFKFALGADPEFFLKDSVSGKNVSAHDLVPGTKQEPYKLKDGAVQVDGVAVEFNINPAFSAEEFEHNMNSVMAEVRNMIDKRYEFDVTPCTYFDKSYFDTLPDFVKELGCDPDISAFTGKPKPDPFIADGLTNVPRTAAGHIHLGWTSGKDVANDEGHKTDCHALANLFYDTLGSVFKLLEPDKGKARKRLLYYGHSGAYRVKPYGIEFRSPSNTWIKHPKMYIGIYNMFEIFYKAALSGDYYNLVTKYNEARSDIQNTLDWAGYKPLKASRIGLSSGLVREMIQNG